MQRLYRFFSGWIRTALDSLAFLPLPMMLGALILGVSLFYLELHTEISTSISENFPSMMVSSQETARTVLSILIGGIITLTVFTFTQMMTLFSQVAAGYSPRLLPIFTGNWALQFVMGFYLSSIIITILVLLSIRENEDGFIPNLSVLFCILLGVLCLVFFLYFVTKISTKIQVDNIIEHVYQRGLNAFDAAKKSDRFARQELPAGIHSWQPIASPISGFVGSINYDRLANLADTYDTRFFIGTARGQFVPRNHPLLQTERPLGEEQRQAVLEAVSPIHRKFSDWHLPPVRLLTEIAVKAMSPGINDPGTAIDVTDRLTGLLSNLMELPHHNVFRPDGKDHQKVWLTTHSFPEVLAAVMQELRTYCNRDPLVMRRLLLLLFHLHLAAANGSANQAALTKEIRLLVEDAQRHLCNSGDRQHFARDFFQYRKWRHQHQAKYL